MIAAAAAKEEYIKHEALISGLQARRQAEAASAKGEEQIRLELIAKLAVLTDRERKQGFDLKDDRIAAEMEADHKIKELRDKNAEDLISAQSAARVAETNDFYRNNAQIVADYERRVREIRKMQEDTVINDREADGLIVAAHRTMNAQIRDEHKRMVEQLGGELQSLADDIGSGNLGKRLVDNAKKIFYQILANWIITMRQMRGGAEGSTGGGGGVLGGIGSIIFGPGSSGANVGAGSTPSTFPGQGFFGGGLGGGIPGFGMFGAPSLGSMTTPSISSSNDSGSVSIGRSGNGPLGLSLGPRGSALAGLGGILGVSAANKFGGNTAALGAMIGIGGLAALYGPSASASLAAAPFAPYLGPAAGGLVGFGVGYQTGSKTIGGLSGAGTGALVGLLAAGPIGAAIGGLVGLVGGIFGGIFGGSKKRHEAQKIVDQIFPQMQAIQDAYKGFQLDYVSALAGLEQLKQQSFPQLEKLGGEGRKYERAMIPWFDKTRTLIDTIEAERQRRSGLQFGPPQFAVGTSFVQRTGLAVVHKGEKISTADETRRQDRGSSSGDGVHIHLHTLDTKTMSTWLRNGGAQMIVGAMGRLKAEGF
jgi:hypothetical protein